MCKFRTGGFLLVLEKHKGIFPLLTAYLADPTLQIRVAVLHLAQPQISPVRGCDKRRIIAHFPMRDAIGDLSIAQEIENLIVEPRFMAKLKRKAEVYITHLKPGEVELTMQEIHDCAGEWKPRMLENNQVFEL